MSYFPNVRQIAFCAVLCIGQTAFAVGAVRVSPATVVLERPEASQQLLVAETFAEGRVVDVTRTVSYQSASPALLSVDAAGLVRPVADGRGEVIIRHGGSETRVPVEVRGLTAPPPVSFRYDVLPILTKARCNAGGCHGKAEGQNGFKLSVFGFDPEADHHALLAEGRGRRLMLSSPDSSLLLRKATAETPHGGGLKIEKESDRYRLLRRWIKEGAHLTATGESPVARIEVEPQLQVLLAGETQQLRVTAIAEDGSRRCVTTSAEFESNANTIAVVDERGFIKATEVPGEAAILVRYLGHVAACRVTLPRPNTKFPRPAELNFIDRLVFDKLERLGIPPSDLADDATFLRRAFLDVIGALPTADEARRFLTDPAADKRQRLVNDLLQRPEYAEYWAMRWSDLLRVDPAAITPQGAVAMTRWLRKQFAENRPYDQFVRDIVTAQGSTLAESPAAFFKALDTPEKMSRSVSQMFLGVRLECAQCHHHPSDRWGQDDYAGFAGFFAGVTRKPLPSGGEGVVSRGGTDLKHPRTGEVIPARVLGAPPADFTNVSDRRVVLAKWLTSVDNPLFTRMIVNRLWSHYFGRGLVEPIDDLRATNPATNEPLLDALCAHMREVKFDLKAFTRTILASRAYQVGAASPANADDVQNFSRAIDKALPAEVLLDMFSQTLGVPEKFNGWPLGYRSVQLWDSRVPSYFFRIFGRPVRATVCECERSTEPSISQALHLLNSPEITEKLQHRHGTARQLADVSRPDTEVIDELYLATLSRLPRDEERRLMLEAFSTSASVSRRQAVEDVLWTLLNAKEFLYNH